MEDPAHMLLTGVLSLFLQSLKFRAHWAWVLLDERLPASWHPHHLKCFGSLASGLVTAELLGRETPSVTSSLMLKLQRSRTHAHAGGHSISEAYVGALEGSLKPLNPSRSQPPKCQTSSNLYQLPQTSPTTPLPQTRSAPGEVGRGPQNPKLSRNTPGTIRHSWLDIRSVRGWVAHCARHGLNKLYYV